MFREIKEEIGLDVLDLKFLCVEYKSAKEGKDENLQFIFQGEILSSSQIKRMKLPAKELNEYKFVKPEEALLMLNENLKNRLEKCLKYIDKNKAIYLENGKEI